MKGWGDVHHECLSASSVIWLKCWWQTGYDWIEGLKKSCFPAMESDEIRQGFIHQTSCEGEQPLEAARLRTPTPSWSWNKMRSSWLARFHLGMLLRHGNQATSILFPQEQLLFASGLLLDLFVWGPFYWDRIEVLGLIYPLVIEHSYSKWHIEIVDLLNHSMVSIPEIGDFPTVLPCWLVTIPRSLRGWIPLATPSQTSRGDLAGFDLWLELVSNFWKAIF